MNPAGNRGLRFLAAGIVRFNGNGWSHGSVGPRHLDTPECDGIEDWIEGAGELAGKLDEVALYAIPIYALAKFTLEQLPDGFAGGVSSGF